MQKFEDFKQSILSRIKEIDAEYKSQYETYEPTKQEQKLSAFLDDLWGVRFENETLNDSMKNASVQLSFIDKDNPHNFVDKSFRRSKLHPKQKKTTPLYFLITRLADSKDYNFFLCPNLYMRSKGHYQNWEQFISASNAYFIDIDEVRMKKPVYNCTEKEIRAYLLEEYPVLREVPPSYIVMSGGGLHLYFILKHTEYLYGRRYQNKMRGMHRQLTSDYIKLLSGDVACKNLNRLLRVPYSYNMKYSIKTRFFSYEEQSKVYSYERLKETAASFLPKRVPVVQAEEKKEGAVPLSEKPKEKKHTERKNANTTEEYRSLVASNAKKALFTARKNDLEAWFFSHKKDMNGYRHKFFLIYSIMLKQLSMKGDYIERQCSALNDMLSEPLPEAELEKTLQGKCLYNFKNETIADWLDFTYEDMNSFSCNYSREAIAEHRKEYAKAYRERKRAERADELAEREKEQTEKKERIFEIIKQNEAATVRQMAVLLNCSPATAHRWICTYKKSL